ncbi:MAG: gliding motility-associated protein GldE [Bacteroidetes bacterium]|nr:gliding motility-associated protein GldE [Bacteroidota bacterium]
MEPPQLLHALDVLLFFKPLEPSIILVLIAILVLLVLSALISGSEVAFFSLKPTQLDDLNSSNDEEDQRLIALLNAPEQLLATVLICNNLVNVAIIVLSTVLVEGVLDFNQITELQGFLIQVVAVTFLILMAGEVIPKVYASTHNLKMAKFMTFPLGIMNSVLAPMSRSMIALSRFFKRFVKNRNDLTVGHLEHALEITKEDTSTEESRILEGIVKFGNTDVKQVMTPRVDAFAVDIKTDYGTLLEKVVEMGFSRVPVYRDSLDQIVGLLYLKDLLPFIDIKNLSWQKLIKEAYFVPESKKIDDLLKEFQGMKRHLAIVVDEYGGTSGIITLEDVIEEIVGEITDEFDETDLNYTKIDECNYVMEGKTPLIDMYRILDIEGADFEALKGEADTLAGFIIEQAGKIPLKNERIDFGAYTFIIEAADRRKIRQVKVTIPQENPEDAG